MLPPDATPVSQNKGIRHGWNIGVYQFQTGITTRELMVRIGHSSPRAALIYQHATEERDRAVADQLDILIASTERTPRAKVVKLPRDPRAMDAG